MLPIVQAQPVFMSAAFFTSTLHITLGCSLTPWPKGWVKGSPSLAGLPSLLAWLRAWLRVWLRVWLRAWLEEPLAAGLAGGILARSGGRSGEGYCGVRTVRIANSRMGHAPRDRRTDSRPVAGYAERSERIHPPARSVCNPICMCVQGDIPDSP